MLHTHTPKVDSWTEGGMEWQAAGLLLLIRGLERIIQLRGEEIKRVTWAPWGWKAST